MRRAAVSLVLSLLPTLLLPACASTPRTVPDAPQRVGDVDYEQIAPGVWVHTTYLSSSQWGLVPCNGLIVRGQQGAVIIDTGCSDADMAKISDWAARYVAPVAGVVITHAHEDSLGGIDEAHRRGLPTIAHARTQELAGLEGHAVPTRGFHQLYDLRAFGINGECFYPGVGHSPDNTVVWLEDAGVLFGGCFVRPGDAQGMGNTADADLSQWPLSIQRALDRYADVAIVVPGHGAPGDAGLLAHTHQLLRQRARAEAE